VAIATDGHGAPAATVGAGIVVEEKAARGIGAPANGGLGAFDEELGGGASQGRKQPIESTFAGYELQRPRTFLRNEFIMSLGDTEDFVDGLDPGRRDWFFVDDRSENSAKGFAKAEDTKENSIDGLGLGVEKGAEPRGTIVGH